MRTILATLLLGITLIYLGLEKNGYALLMSWLGFSFFLTGLSYIGILDSNIYGKDGSRGQIPPGYTLLHLPFLLYTWSIWYLIQFLTRENAYDRINENIIIGRRLSKDECPKGVVNLVDLTVEFNEHRALVEHSNYIFLPILDGSVPDFQQLEKSFAKLNDGLTYIHCAQGHGRTGLFTALLLASKGLVTSTEQALVLLKKKRPALALNKEQKQFLQNYLDNKLNINVKSGLE